MKLATVAGAIPLARGRRAGSGGRSRPKRIGRNFPKNRRHFAAVVAHVLHFQLTDVRRMTSASALSLVRIGGRSNDAEEKRIRLLRTAINASIVLKLRRRHGADSKSSTGTRERFEAHGRLQRKSRSGVQARKEYHAGRPRVVRSSTRRRKSSPSRSLSHSKSLEQGLNRVESVSGRLKNKWSRSRSRRVRLQHNRSRGRERSRRDASNGHVGLQAQRRDYSSDHARSRKGRQRFARGSDERPTDTEEVRPSLDHRRPRTLTTLRLKSPLRVLRFRKCQRGAHWQRRRREDRGSALSALRSSSDYHQKGVQGAEAGEALNLMFRNLNKANVQKIIGEASRGMVKIATPRAISATRCDSQAELCTVIMPKKGDKRSRRSDYVSQYAFSAQRKE